MSTEQPVNEVVNIEPEPGHINDICGTGQDQYIDHRSSDGEKSIECDGPCDKCFYYMCVVQTGNEIFLKRKRSKWYCDICKSSSRKRKK